MHGCHQFSLVLLEILPCSWACTPGVDRGEEGPWVGSEERNVRPCLGLRAHSCLSLQMATESHAMQSTCSVAARSLPRLPASPPAQRPAGAVEPHQTVHPDAFKARPGWTACHRWKCSIFQTF